MRATPAYPPVFQSDAAWYDARRTWWFKTKHEQRSARSFQRRRYRHHHHDHGARAARPARYIAGGLATCHTDVLSYALSFVFVGIYWNNHHHLLHATQKVNGATLWANLHLLFWLSLVPFVTGWMGQNHFAAVPVAVYGVVLLLAAIAFTILAKTLIACNGADSPIAVAIGSDRKGKTSVAIYVLAIICARLNPWLSVAMYMLVAVIWFVPDRRIERVIAQ